MRRYEQNIMDFIFWQKNHFNDIKELKIEEHKHHEKLYKKTLFFPLIDSLAKAYTRGKNREKFIRLIEDLSDWNEKNLVSIIHLKKFIDIINNDELIPIKSLCDIKYSQLKDGRIYQIKEIDIEFADLERSWPKERNNSLKRYRVASQSRNLSLENFCHKSLLYSYRNFCIHEFRSAGSDLIVSGSDKPNYINISKQNGKEWNLVYPIEFFSDLVEKLIKNLNNYLHDNQIDPYNSFNYSSYWIEELD